MKALVIAVLAIIVLAGIVGLAALVALFPVNTLGILFGLAIIYLSVAIRIVTPPNVWIVEINLPWLKETIKLKWESGFHILVFPVEQIMYVRNKVYCGDDPVKATIGVPDGQLGGPSPIEFINDSAGVEIQLIFRVFDPLKATYEVGDYKATAVTRAEANFRRFLSTMELDEAIRNIEARSALAQEAFRDVNAALERWGVALVNPGNEITIVDFILSPETTTERRKVITAEKEATAKITAAKAEKEAAIITAEGRREAAILTAEGEAKAIQLLREAEGKGESEKVHLLMEQLTMTKEQATDYLLKIGMIDAVKGSTLIATSEGGDLNFPVKMAATMAAVNSNQNPPLNPPSNVGNTSSGSGTGNKGGKP